MLATRLTVPGTAVVALLLAAGCGGSSNNNGSASTSPATTTARRTATGATQAAGAQVLRLSADPSGQLKFNTTKLSAKAGAVTLRMSNPSAVQHAVAVEGNGVDKDGAVVGQGGTSSVTVDLKPGTYTFYCPVPGHRQAGMQGTLTVS